ncbi:hypothetical protein ACIHCQ_39970 [Streptomyces sp. NPDC052236]|uniref:hypothetical protein n=1 Tax=Streptomyces sp. NPDC052236 TaxID=3365686 RepID=UPI0037D0B898
MPQLLVALLAVVCSGLLLVQQLVLHKQPGATARDQPVANYLSSPGVSTHAIGKLMLELAPSTSLTAKPPTSSPRCATRWAKTSTWRMSYEPRTAFYQVDALRKSWCEV